MMPMPAPSTHQPRLDDPNQALRPGLVAAALQASIPLGLFLLVMLLDGLVAAQRYSLDFSTLNLFDSFHQLFVAGGFNFYLITSARLFTGNFYSGFTTGALIAELLPQFLLTLLPLVGVAIIDFVVSRRVTRATGSAQAGLRACLWGHAGYLVALFAIIFYVYRELLLDFGSYRSPSMAVFFEVLAFFVLLQIGLALGVRQIFGRWGGAQGMQARGATEPGASPALNDVAAARNLAARSNLGSFVRVFAPTPVGTVILRGIGLVVFFIALLLVQRYVLNIGNTEPALTTIVGLVGSIGYMIEGIRRSGQPVHLFQDGIVGFSEQQRLVAMRWDEIQPLTPRSPLQVVSRAGDRIVIPSTLPHADELTELVRQGVTRAAMAKQ
jgi:hypothetical protein